MDSVSMHVCMYIEAILIKPVKLHMPTPLVSHLQSTPRRMRNMKNIAAFSLLYA